ncbi:hypothetical protein BZA77DRAFT_362307 [Pyronema omphalodes]|nr:hypothetical protein BZA77DRAFT_362307 [Pyronema omphalodes]
MSTPGSQKITSPAARFLGIRFSAQAQDAGGNWLVYDVDHEVILERFSPDDRPDTLGYLGGGVWIAGFLDGFKISSATRSFVEHGSCICGSVRRLDANPGTPNVDTSDPGTINPGIFKLVTSDAATPNVVTRKIITFNPGTTDPRTTNNPRSTKCKMGFAGYERHMFAGLNAITVWYKNEDTQWEDGETGYSGITNAVANGIIIKGGFTEGFTDTQPICPDSCPVGEHD